MAVQGNKIKYTGSLEDDLYLVCLIAPIITVPMYLFICHLAGKYIGIPCILYEKTGIFCPGCGGSRAIITLLQGNLLASFWYHPAVLYSLVLYLGFVLTQTLERLHIGRIKGWKYHNWWLYGAGGLLVFNCVFKNVLKFVFRLIV